MCLRLELASRSMFEFEKQALSSDWLLAATYTTIGYWLQLALDREFTSRVRRISDFRTCPAAVPTASAALERPDEPSPSPS
jgi:hypothetical protein